MQEVESSLHTTEIHFYLLFNLQFTSFTSLNGLWTGVEAVVDDAPTLEPTFF